MGKASETEPPELASEADPVLTPPKAPPPGNTEPPQAVPPAPVVHAAVPAPRRTPAGAIILMILGALMLIGLSAWLIFAVW